MSQHPPTSVAEPIVYPECDGQPMAETGIHVNAMLETLAVLLDHFHDEPKIHVGANIFMYYVEGDPKQCVSPDVFVTIGIDKEPPRRTYRTWVEGKPPDVIFEMTSPSTKSVDLGRKKQLYQRLGVQEYFLFDPLGEYLKPPLRGFRLDGEQYVEIVGKTLESRVLKLSLSKQKARLVLTDTSGQPLLNRAEKRERINRSMAEAKQARAEAEQSQSEAEQAQSEAEQARAEAEQSQSEVEQAQSEAEQARAEAEQARADADETATRLLVAEERIRALERKLC